MPSKSSTTPAKAARGSKPQRHFLNRVTLHSAPLTAGRFSFLRPVIISFNCFLFISIISSDSLASVLRLPPSRRPQYKAFLPKHSKSTHKSTQIAHKSTQLSLSAHFLHSPLFCLFSMSHMQIIPSEITSGTHHHTVSMKKTGIFPLKTSPIHPSVASRQLPCLRGAADYLSGTFSTAPLPPWSSPKG